MPAIGIDLGTTYCCVGAFIQGKVEIIANDHGNFTTPSYVAFTNSERLVGDAAKKQVGMNPSNTIFDVKRLIGRTSVDPNVLGDVQRWPFQVGNDSGKPVISVEFKGQQKEFAPEQISAMLLTKMKETAEAMLDQPVTEAVITVPAYFNDSQRQATKDAGTIAGLRVLGILNEPTAAALAYGLEKSPAGKRNVLIFDLGGGTFDVSLLTIDAASKFEVLAVAGDTHLGGEDFDSRLMDYCSDLFNKRNRMDLGANNPKALSRLCTAVESAKRTLSFETETSISVDGLYEGIDFCTTISRARFEELCSDLFSQTLQLVQRVLNDAKMHKSQVDDIIVVGGSTRIPKVRSLLQSFFGGRELKQYVHPEHAVAYGAAIQAALLAGDLSSEIRDLLLVDVVPLSLGIEIGSDDGEVRNKMSTIIERNTRIPCKHTKGFTTARDNQKDVILRIFEGEHDTTDRNHLLGTFVLTDIPAGPARFYKLDVTFNLDANGILSATAKERSTGNENSITIQYDKGRLSSAEINRMMEEARKYDSDSAMLRWYRKARNKLEGQVYRAMAIEATDDKRRQEIKAGLHCLEVPEVVFAEDYIKNMDLMNESMAALTADDQEEEESETTTNSSDWF